MIVLWVFAVLFAGAVLAEVWSKSSGWRARRRLRRIEDVRLQHLARRARLSGRRRSS